MDSTTNLTNILCKNKNLFTCVFYLTTKPRFSKYDTLQPASYSTCYQPQAFNRNYKIRGV